MPRVSQKLLSNRLKFAADALGMRVAKKWDDVGGLQLGQSYGGVQLEVVHNAQGGIGTIGPRMRATDMADALQIVADLVRVRDDSRFYARARALESNPDGATHTRGVVRVNPYHGTPHVVEVKPSYTIPIATGKEKAYIAWKGTQSAPIGFVVAENLKDANEKARLHGGTHVRRVTKNQLRTAIRSGFVRKLLTRKAEDGSVFNA